MHYTHHHENHESWHRELRAAWEHSKGAYRAAYRAYCASPEYRRFRARLRKVTLGLCQRCNQKHKEMHIHHLHYLTVGKERLHDVRYLCKPCHDAVGVKGNREVIPPCPAQRESARQAHAELEARMAPTPPTPGRRRSISL
jgi:5-methylcytosine-specific restriction endonuclease McrA